MKNTLKRKKDLVSHSWQNLLSPIGNRTKIALFPFQYNTWEGLDI